MPITNAIRIIRFQLHVHRLNGIDHLVSARTNMKSAIEDANIHCQKGTFEASSQNKVGGEKKGNQRRLQDSNLRPRTELL